jgi:hypothetical protein
MPFDDATSLHLVSTHHLALQRCPHCRTAIPTLTRKVTTFAQPGKQHFLHQIQGQALQWHIYACESCGGLIGAAIRVAVQQASALQEGVIQWLVPHVDSVSSDLPPQAARYLAQARETISSPDSSVMTSASAVDAMLKARGYTPGTLYSRIVQAEQDGVLTKDMSAWAHDIRLDANDERHADLAHTGATAEDAQRCLDFADALADLLFVLPARVKRGLKPKPAPTTK